jgi:hypothetical protein
MIFYTYLWLREDGTPYYVGKGKGNRAFVNRGRKAIYRPVDDLRILIQEHESELDAFEAEKFLILYYGRLDLGTGCLHNLTNGGDGTSGAIWMQGESNPMFGKKRDFSAVWRHKLGASHRGKKFTAEHARKLGRSGQLNPMFGKTGSQNPFFGKKHSEETKRKLREARRAYCAKQKVFIGDTCLSPSSSTPSSYS